MTTQEEDSAADARKQQVTSHNSKRQRRALSWRMDPAESFSDFVIEICVSGQSESNNKSDTTYHVHKNILAFGEKGSAYFDGLLASQTAESTNNKTRIQLNCEPAAKAFPLLLDYMYGLDYGKPKLTIESAAPLYHLADYFEVESLHKKILVFWTENMGVDDLAACLQQSVAFRIDSLRDIVVKKCASTISDIAVDSPLLGASDSKFWVDVHAESNKCSPFGVHLHVHALLAEFCSKRKHDLNAETFQDLIGLLPKWHPCLCSFDDAVKFLEVEKVVVPEANLGNEELTVLQEYFLECLAREWERWVDSTILQCSLKKISPHLFSRATAMSLKWAREEKDALDMVVDHTAAGHPTKVTLTGAGAASANGVYSRRIDFDPSDPEYFMEGLWDEGPAQYVIEIKLLGPEESMPVWFVCVERTGRKDKNLYTSPVFTNKRLSSWPRMKGWRPWGKQRVEEGGDSQPTLLYHFD